MAIFIIILQQITKFNLSLILKMNYYILNFVFLQIFIKMYLVFFNSYNDNDLIRSRFNNIYYY